MQRLEVSCAVRRIYTSLGAKGLMHNFELPAVLDYHDDNYDDYDMMTNN